MVVFFEETGRLAFSRGHVLPGSLRPVSRMPRTPGLPSMALTAGNADAQTRPLPSAWTPLDNPHNMQEALEALDTYKKKDPSKGASFPHSRSPMLNYDWSFSCSFWRCI